jgi:hypothetical protein
MRALVDVAETVYVEDDSATSAVPLLELFATEVVPEDDVAPVVVAALDAESSFAPLQAARAVSSAQSVARIRVLKCMLMLPSPRCRSSCIFVITASRSKLSAQSDVSQIRNKTYDENCANDAT